MAPARRDVVWRGLAAVVGGYGVANLVPVALTAGWGWTRVDAALAAMQFSFVVYAAAVMWAFGARSARVAWIGLGGVALVAGAVVGWVT